MPASQISVRTAAMTSEKVKRVLWYQAAGKGWELRARMLPAHRQTRLSRPSRAEAVLAMARSDHGRWVSTPRWARASRGDLDLPAAHEEGDDGVRLEVGVGVEEGLQVALDVGVSDQHPADGFGRRAGTVPECGSGEDLEGLVLLVAVPVPDRGRGPDGVGVVEVHVELRQRLSLDSRPPLLTGWARRWRREPAGIEPQPADQRGLRADGVGEFMGAEAAVADEDDGAVRQPSEDHQHDLARPFGQRLVAASLVFRPARRLRQQRQERQGLDAGQPGQRRQQHEAEPAPAAGLDEVAAAGADGIAVDAAGADARAPAPLDGVVEADFARAGRSKLHAIIKCVPRPYQPCPMESLRRAVRVALRGNGFETSGVPGGPLHPVSSCWNPCVRSGRRQSPPLSGADPVVYRPRQSARDRIPGHRATAPVGRASVPAPGSGATGVPVTCQFVPVSST